jgi:hypothetical protein
MKRLYYITRSLDSTESISRDLHEEGISDWNFHVLSKDEAGLYKRHIHSANYLHKLDLIRSAEVGGLIGLGFGLALAAAIMATSYFGDSLHWLVYVGIVAVVAMFGTWAGGIWGLGHENYKIRKFHGALEAGRYLVMIDVHRDEKNAVKAVMARLHPEAQLMGVDSTWVNPMDSEPHMQH